MTTFIVNLETHDHLLMFDHMGLNEVNQGNHVNVQNWRLKLSFLLVSEYSLDMVFITLELLFYVRSNVKSVDPCHVYGHWQNYQPLLWNVLVELMFWLFYN